jgi:hypothetical protein
MRRGPTPGRSFRLRIGISHAATKQPNRSVVGRLLDTFDNDAGGVSALQHFRGIVPAEEKGPRR